MKSELISQNEFANRLGCAHSQVQSVIKRGILKLIENDSGKLKLDWLPQLEAFAAHGNARALDKLKEFKESTKYIYTRKNSTGQPKSGSLDIDNLDFSTMDSVDAAHAIAIIKVKKALVDLKVAESKSMEIDIAVSIFAQVAESVKKSFLAMPNRVASMMEGLDYKARHRLLVDEINNSLEKLSIDIVQEGDRVLRDLKNQKQKEFKNVRRRKRKEDKK